MSYCRFSSDGFQCDVYCYGSMGGYTIHVAGRRHVFPEPLPVMDLDDDILTIRAKIEKSNELQAQAKIVKIGGPHDGESFRLGTAGECADKLEELRKAGYVVPQYAIDALREEQAEKDEETEAGT